MPQDRPPRPLLPIAAGAAAVGLLAAGTVWLGGRQQRAAEGPDEAAAWADAARARAAALRGGPGAGVAALTARTADGRVAPLSAAAPGVLMVVSETCGVCKEALADFGRLRGGRPLPRLWVVAVEGAAAAVPMTRAAGVAGAVHAGPVTPAAAALFNFQVSGTPTFVALDARGRVAGVLPGYPGAEAMRPWLRLMAGDADAL